METLAHLALKRIRDLEDAIMRLGHGHVDPHTTMIGNLAPDTMDPEGVKTAPPGTMYYNLTTGVLWTKAIGTGNTGWV